MIPAQFSGLLCADADSEAEHDVGVQPGLPGRVEQRKGLVRGERPARSADPSFGRVDQGGHVPADEVVRLGASDGPRQEGPGDLQIPGRQISTECLKPGSDIPGREFPERSAANALQERLQGLLIDGPRTFGSTRQAVLEPVVRHIALLTAVIEERDQVEWT